MALSNKSYDFTDYDMVIVEKTEEKRNKEIARNMLKKGYEVSSISDITELTIEEVEELKKNLK